MDETSGALHQRVINERNAYKKLSEKLQMDVNNLQGEVNQLKQKIIEQQNLLQNADKPTHGTSELGQELDRKEEVQVGVRFSNRKKTLTEKARYNSSPSEMTVSDIKEEEFSNFTQDLGFTSRVYVEVRHIRDIIKEERAAHSIRMTRNADEGHQDITTIPYVVGDDSDLSEPPPEELDELPPASPKKIAKRKREPASIILPKRRYKATERRAKTSRVPIKYIPTTITLPSNSSSTTLLSTYISNLTHSDIPPSTTPALTTRAYLQNKLGVLSQSLLSITKDRLYLFPTKDVNPFRPKKPGRSGLMFTSRMDMTEGVWSVFRPVKSEKYGRPRNRKFWIYLGEYTGHHVGMLSEENFENLEMEVKNAWGEKIINNRMWPVYSSMRARIHLRSINQPLTDNNVQMEMDRIRKCSKGTQPNSLTPAAVEHAFIAGEEEIGIIELRFHKYDDEFADTLSTDIENGAQISEEAE